MKKTTRLLKLIFASSLLFCVATTLLSAAVVDPAPLIPAAEEKSWLDNILAGGMMMIPLGLLSISAVGLIFYNFYALKRSNFINDDIIDQIKASMTQLDLQGAHQLCEANPTPITNIMRHGLEEVMEDPDPATYEKALEAAAVKELAAPYVVINYISIIAAISPMTGLAGTVLGMVKAFNTIAAQGMGKPELLAVNISEALITTLTGMVIGIPAMFFFFLFKNKYGTLVSEITMMLGQNTNSFSTAIRHYYAGGSEEQ